jgi:WXG100 family type VII secretion target
MTTPSDPRQQTVDIAGMKAAYPAFESALTSTKSSHDSMMDQENTLRQSWKGDAANGFLSALDQWLDNCATVQQQLQIVTDKLAEHTGVYEKVHSNTTDTSQSLQQTMSAGLPGF